MTSSRSQRSRARALAVRAAQVACGLAAVGCGSPAVTEPDAGADAPLVFYEHDAFVDAHFPGDADCRAFIPSDRVCCLLSGGEWYVYDGGFAECFVGVPGPFVPPERTERT